MCCVSARPDCCCWRRRRHAAVATAVGSGAHPRAGAIRRADQCGAPPRGRRRRRGARGSRRAASGHAGVAVDLLGGQGARDRPGPSARGAARPDPQAGRRAARRRAAAHRLAALSRRHPCHRTAGLRTRRFLGAGRRRRPAGQTARGTCRANASPISAPRPAARRPSLPLPAHPSIAVERDAGASGAPAGEPAALASGGRTGAGRRRRMDARPAIRRRAAGCAVQRHRHDPPPSRCAACQAAARRAGAGGDAGPAAAGRRQLCSVRAAG